jgi:MFS transporter, FHS family, glucose/mannose:H+ symporter
MYVGFALTGMGTVLLGCVLPTLIAKWHLDDTRAGILFAAQFAGSALGAGLVSHDYFKSIVRGYALLTVGALALAWFNRSPHSWLFLSFGLGLGLTMTATSMLMGSLYPLKRGAVLSSLNACWCLGAVLCPAMVSLWVERWPVATLFLAFGFTVAMVLFLAGNVAPALPTRETQAPAQVQERFPLLLIAAFTLVGFLYVGVEASVSSWMMVYASARSGFLFLDCAPVWPCHRSRRFALDLGRAITEHFSAGSFNRRVISNYRPLASCQHIHRKCCRSPTGTDLPIVPC